MTVKKEKIRVVFLGERDFYDYSTLVKLAKDSGLEITEVVAGDNKGVDELAARFATEYSLKLTKYCIDWNDCTVPSAVVKTGKYGEYNSRAPFDKNQKIADYATHGIALQNSGMDTDDMSKRLKKQGKSVFVGAAHSDEVYQF